MSRTSNVIGRPLDRVDGIEKVSGTAVYAYEHNLERAAYVFPIQSTIARGRVVSIDPGPALKVPGVLAVLSHRNAPRLGPIPTFRQGFPVDHDLALFQSDRVAYHGQFVAAVVAESLETARYAAELVAIRYVARPHDVLLAGGRSRLEKPAQLNGGYRTDTFDGDVEAALTTAPITIDHTYTTATYHHNPIEPHSAVADWRDNGLTLYDSNQGSHAIRSTLGPMFGLPLDRVHVVAPYVGGAFGSKALPKPPVVLAVMASRVTGRPVKIALTREQMFADAGYRTPTIQRIRLGADRDGRLTAIVHDAVEQTATITEFAEQTVVPTRMMYAAPNRRTTVRLARLDVPVPCWMRAPGECPGMYALESAMDELAVECNLDPIELRIRNEPTVDPETGHPFSSRNLVACLREGARRFGWELRDPAPRARRDGRWLVGTGVAASTYPTRRQPSTARIYASTDGHYTVLIDATDIGTGARTALTQIASDALDVPIEQVRLEIGDSALPPASVAGGSSGTASWGSAIVEAARALRARLRDEYGGVLPDTGIDVTVALDAESPESKNYSIHAFGAQFAEVRVNEATGEVRVSRLLGVFATGRVINPKTARSQLIGGMTMGLSMALFEASVIDPRFGDYVNHDLAEYHLATNADTPPIEVAWIDEEEQHANPLGVKGLGEIGIVGTAAAIANAVYHATGIRVRDLPITLDKLIA
jgi:xanthine dehydrogenase YagR molybdenum-binding subunit